MMTRRPGGWKTQHPYIIWAFDYQHASAGPKALHRLCHELNEAGQTAYIGPHTVTNPEWNTPVWPNDDPPEGEWIAVYPEIIYGNPWDAPHVARWVLNVPGKLGGQKSYDPSEMVFSWSPLFLDGVPRLYLPAVELDIYIDRHEPRSGELFYVGKGQQGETAGAQPVTMTMREDRHALADALNHATLLRSFDDVSGMNDIALLCGCPVLVAGKRREPDGFRERFVAACAEFPAQLARFVEITQAAKRATPLICAVIPTRYHPPELDRLLGVLTADGVCVHLIVDKSTDHRIHRMWNDGADAARAHGATYIAVLNDDITILPGTVPLLARTCANHRTLGLVYPDVAAPFDSLPDNPAIVAGTIDDSGRPICGYCFLFRAATGVRFDESYRWWYGDNQFHKDVQSAGWLAGYAVGVPIRHRESSSASKHDDFFGPLIVQDRDLWTARLAGRARRLAAYGSSYRDEPDEYAMSGGCT